MFDDGLCEEGLIAASRTTRRVIRQALQTCDPHVVGRSALEYVNRRETGEKTNEKPFYARQKVQTVRKYSHHWVKILRYIWRTCDIEGRPKYILTSNQGRRLQRLRRLADREEEVSRIEVEEDPIRRGGARPTPPDRQRELDAACLEFWIAMFDHELSTGEFESGIISALAVLGLNTEKGGWKEAINYTPILSAIVTGTRALVIHQAWKDREDEIQRLQQEGWREEAARQQATSVFRFTQTMVHRFMTLTGIRIRAESHESSVAYANVRV